MNEYEKLNDENSENINTDKLNKDNSDIINKLYSTSNLSKNHDCKTEFSKMARLKNDGESEKHIKEMHALADKNELKNNAIVLGLGIFIVSIIVFTIIMNTSLMQPKAFVAATKKVKVDIVDSSSTKKEVTKPVENDIYAYLNVETNKAACLKKAIDLNNGTKTGITIYLLAEILRSNSYDIPVETSTVKGLMTNLTSNGWEKNTDFNKLQKGDICFTTDVPGKTGVPSHAYIFMGWVEDGKTDYANIVDGQIEEYDNVFHKRNLSIVVDEKDKFSFFLKK